MLTLTRTFRRVLGQRTDERAPETRAETRPRVLESPPIDIAPNDPILAYFHAGSGAVPIDELQLDSPAVRALRSAGVKLVVPLISQGELIGLLNLGRRLSDQDYSTDDRRLLEKLAAQASPAVRVAQLVREQEAEVRARERISQELRVAQLIQQQFLPKTVPDLPGWQIAAFYRAAAEVGGDGYDFIELPEARIGRGSLHQVSPPRWARAIRWQPRLSPAWRSACRTRVRQKWPNRLIADFAAFGNAVLCDRRCSAESGW